MLQIYHNTSTTTTTTATMGKTLKRQRARALREAAAEPPSAAEPLRKLPRLADGASKLTAGASSSRFTAAVSAALQKQQWSDAVAVLEAMQQYGKVPKLGAVQRWVRDADMAGSEGTTARLLDAILRCTMGPAAAGAAPAPAPATAESPLQGSITRHPPWRAAQAAAAAAAADAVEQQQDSAAAPAAGEAAAAAPGAAAAASVAPPPPPSAKQLRELVFEVPFQAGAGGPDAIHALPPDTIRLDTVHPPVRAVPVPFVPGAMLLQGVLSPAECGQIMAAAEAIGWHSNVDYTFGGAAGDDGGSVQQRQHQQQQDSEQADAKQAAAPEANADAPTAGHSAARGSAAAVAGLQEGRPAAGCVWLADESLLAPLYKRVQHLLPQQLEGGALAGINARWRLYRYMPGAVYRPHVDGAWPGSGVDERGQYVFDAFGDRWSRLTFLVYLNDGFGGGATTYYTPSEAQVGVLDARGVLPVQGNVLVFPHGGTKGSLVHEGSAVLKGAKYVIRTDVLYLNPPTAGAAQASGAAGRGGRRVGGGGGGSGRPRPQ